MRKLNAVGKKVQIRGTVNKLIGNQIDYLAWVAAWNCVEFAVWNGVLRDVYYRLERAVDAEVK